MKIFDFNIHLPQKISEDVNEVIADDLSLNTDGLRRGLRVHLPQLTKVSGINVQLFNQQLFSSDPRIVDFLQELRKNFHHILLTALIDFRNPGIEAYLDQAIGSGVNCFMFNSYLQEIKDSDFNDVLRVAKYVEARNRIICIDGSYGTSKMHRYDNSKLACFIADHIVRSPIVIVHSGGYRVMEAMLLAADRKNVFLETSFSLNYYLGSSLEQDYAFAYKRLGAKRVLFGTDVPYMQFDEAFDQQNSFFERFKFSSAEREDIFFNNAIRLINGIG